ncbi:hypothetical protein DXG01_003462, partial [Tephrocybe rancida]
MPSGSDFESMTAAEQLAISWMHPGKRPVSQELLDKEDDEAFEEDLQVEELQAQSAKGKKSKGKKSNVKGPFKSGPIPKQAKQRAFAIQSRYRTLLQRSAKHHSYSSCLWVKVPCSRVVLQPNGAPSRRGMGFTEKSKSQKI